MTLKELFADYDAVVGVLVLSRSDRVLCNGWREDIQEYLLPKTILRWAIRDHGEVAYIEITLDV